jgi:hypothetical protein
MAVLKAFEMRKVDTKYFQMLEKKKWHTYLLFIII